MSKLLFKIFEKKLLFSPIFVVGQGRSGTSALTRSIGSHPSVMFTEVESPLIADLGTTLYNYFNSNISSYYQEHSKISEYELRKYLAKIMLRYVISSELSSKRYFKDIFREIVRERSFTINKKYWIAKTFPDENSFLGLKNLFPKQKVIYIYRNGFDQINSAKKHISFRGKKFSDYCYAYSNHVDKYKYLLKNEEVLKIKHEELIMNTKKTLISIYKYLDIKYSSRPLRFLKERLVSPMDNPLTLKTDVENYFKEREPAYTSWSEEEKKDFKEICQEAMNTLGYEIPY